MFDIGNVGTHTSSGGTILKSRTIVLGFATALILTGCSSAADSPAPSSSTEASTTPSATPTPAAEASTEATTLELSTETLQILTDDGTELQSFSFFAPVDDTAIAALTAAIGEDPVVTPFGDDAANPNYITYEWAGASLTAPNNEPADTQYANWSFGVTAATVGVLDAVTDSGISVGTSRADAEAAGAVLDDTSTEAIYRLGLTEIDRNGEPLPFCLYLAASDDSITEIGGPAHELRG